MITLTLTCTVQCGAINTSKNLNKSPLKVIVLVIAIFKGQ